MPSTTIVQTQPRQPRGVSPWFAIALVGAFSIGLAVFFIAVERRHQPAPTIPAVRNARGDEGWVERVTSPTPMASPTFHVAPRPVAIPQPAVAQVLPYQHPTLLPR